MDICKPTDEGIQKALKILENGGVIAHATETCYGFACDLRNPKAVEKLFLIKMRPMDQSISALFESIEQAKIFVEWSEEAENLARENLPGPMTLILPLLPSAPYQLLPTPSGGETLGIRISSHELAQRLVQDFRRPISTTSANLHGKPNPYSAEEIIAQFKDQTLKPDLILDSGVLKKKKPSTVISLIGDKIAIVRK